jgi:hypothetical protein
MPNTPNGLPYPLASDPVTQGAAAIEALARATDTALVAQNPGYRIEAGRGAFVNGSTVVTFAKPFSGIPSVVITAEGSTGNAAAIQIGAPTATGFTMWNGTGNNAFPISWIAVGH